MCAALERILASRFFARSDRLTRFLRFVVEQVLADSGQELKEQLIGVEVFDRKADYDPRIDPIVRVEARRLRSKLKAYYTASGREDDIVIGLPKGTYVPVFRSRTSTQTASRTEAGEKSIMVLPFSNIGSETGDDYFSDGLTEELIHLLTRVPHLRVVAWDTASQFRGREQDYAGIRQQLKVGAVLRGSVRLSPGRVRVTSQLIDTASGAYLWSHAYDNEMQDVLAIQEEIARAIVDTLQLTLIAGSPRRTPNVASYNLCLEGRFHANKRTREGLQKSATCFEQAVSADNTSAVAYAGLADAHSLLADHSFLEPNEAASKARSAAEKAVALDPQSAEAIVSLAFIRALFDWEWAEAEVLYRKAIAFNPGYSRARHWFSIDHLALLGRFDEALAEIHMARHLDPLSQIIQEGCGYLHMLRGEYDEALEQYRLLVDLDPMFYKGYSSMGRMLSIMGRYDAAIVTLERARSLAGNVPTLLSALGQTLALAGRTAEAKAYLSELHQIARTRWIPLACFAIVHLGLGDHAAALDYLEKACDQRELAITGIKVHPLYDPLRSEPRFENLLKRVHLLP